MKRTRAGTAALLFLFLAGQLEAQPARELQGQVFHLVGENKKKVLEPGLIVTFVPTGATDDTNDQGIFRLPLPPAFQPGTTVSISVEKPGWRIRYPLDGEVRIPRDLSKEIVSIELLPEGSKLFWADDFIEKFIRKVAERSKQGGRSEGRGPSLDLDREIKEWATKYGFSVQQAQEEIDRWKAEVKAAHEDNYRAGLVAFLDQQFDAAAARFRDSAEWRINQLDEARKQQEKMAEQTRRLQEEVVRDLRLQGDSYFNAYRFQQAVIVYTQALGYASKDQTPQLWAAILADIAGAQHALGELGEATESPAHLVAAVDAYRQALLVFTREQLPQSWATMQSLLGNALVAQGLRTSGEQGAQLLAQASDAYRQALLVLTREQLPQDWAFTQHNLGTALQEQGRRTAGEQGSQFLAQAVDAYRQALLVRNREQLPQDWAMTQNNLGNTLQEQGDRTSGEQGTRLLAQAVDAYRQALLVFTREQLPQYWAATQNNLGTTLRMQGLRTLGQQGTQLLAQAIDAYRQALLVFTREQLPQYWALTQDSLGNTLACQGARTPGGQGDQLLSQAIDAFRQALLVRTREQLPQDWAMTQNNIGEALQKQAARAPGEQGSQLLAQAIDAFRQALLVFTPDSSSQYWAATRSNEAKALLALHHDEDAAEALSQVFTKVPDYRPAFDLLSLTLNNRLFRHKEAVALTRSWLDRHPADLPARLALGEQLFASRAFSECSREISSLLKEHELGAGQQVVALGYMIAASPSEKAPNVPDRLETLLGVVAAQPEDFSTSWTFDGTLHSLGEEPEVPHKGWLTRLFRTLEAPDRDKLLKGLRDLQDAMLTEMAQ